MLSQKRQFSACPLDPQNRHATQTPGRAPVRCSVLFQLMCCQSPAFSLIPAWNFSLGVQGSEDHDRYGISTSPTLWRPFRCAIVGYGTSKNCDACKPAVVLSPAPKEASPGEAVVPKKRLCLRVEANGFRWPTHSLGWFCAVRLRPWCSMFEWRGQPPGSLRPRFCTFRSSTLVFVCSMN